MEDHGFRSELRVVVSDLDQFIVVKVSFDGKNWVLIKGANEFNSNSFVSFPCA